MRRWYEELFDNYARKYDQEPFVRGASGECDFIEKEIGRDKTVRILDIGCGTGRHAIELTVRGYSVWGVDLSESQLARAREKAQARGLSIPFLRHDARDLPFEGEFDVAVMLCEGGFSLMETDEMNFKILESAFRSLKPGGKLIFTALNALFPLFHSVKDFMEDHAGEGNAACAECAFDLMTFRERALFSMSDDAGVEKELQTDERYYAPSEIAWLLHSLGFAPVDIYGARLGAFSRNDPLTCDDYEMLVVAQKQGPGA